MTITDKIKSIGQGVGATYRKPDPAKLTAFQEALEASPLAKDYLRISRNLTDETIKHFGLGFDLEREAIAIPVYKRGELINIRYRFLNPGDKAKYGQERGSEVWVYNEDGIQMGMKKGGILIVEGEFDLMSAWQAGFKNVISPTSGKDSYGVWIELLDNIPRIYICYDNDKPGLEASIRLAERLKSEKCSQVLLPPEIKDFNDYAKKYPTEEFRELVKNARPFYRHQFKGVVDIIEELRAKREFILTTRLLPEVEMGDDWLIVVSGDSNIGKTTYTLNLAYELTQQNIPVLVLPFERGMQEVCKRYLQVHHNVSKQQLREFTDAQWDEVIPQHLKNPLYFALPTREEAPELIQKSKRIFDTQVVIIDHLDYIVGSSNNKSNYNEVVQQYLQYLKSVAQESHVILIIVHHLNKPSHTVKKTRPRKEDLKGSSALYQVPEALALLSDPETDGFKGKQLTIDVAKNKGAMKCVTFAFNLESGKIGDQLFDDEEEQKRLRELERTWNSIPSKGSGKSQSTDF